MAKKKKHARGSEIEEFCATAPYGKDCKCPNSYRDNGVPKSPFFDPYQSHHLLPVSCVNHELLEDPDLETLLAATKWCINAEKNTLGMPVWEQTIKHYCKWYRTKKDLDPDPPLFENIPNHLVDHDRYNQDVSGRLLSMASPWKKAKKKHEIEALDVAADLEAASEMMQEELETRGTDRAGGTHKAWLKAVKAYSQDKEFSSWYEPFSMADDARERPFPVRSEKALGLIEKLAAALLK